MTDGSALRSERPDSFAGVDWSVRAATLVTAILSGFLTVALVLLLQPGQEFASPVAGNLAFSGGIKGGDIVALPMAVVVSVLVGAAVRAAIVAQPTCKSRGDMAAHLLWWGCPGGIALGALFVEQTLSLALVGVTLAATLLVVLEGALARSRGLVLTPVALSASALGCVLWAMAPVAGAVALSRTTVTFASLVERVPLVPLAIATAGAAASFELVGAWRGRPSIAAAERRFVSLPQCAMPLLLLAFIPARWRVPDGSIAGYDVKIALHVLCWALAGLGVVICLRRLWRSSGNTPVAGRVEGRLASPLAVLSVLLVAMFGVTREPYINPDDYHFGEALLGWFRYRAGELPYVDHQPAHGILEDDIAAFLASVFFDGSAGANAEAHRLAFALVAALMFVVVLWATGSQLLAGLVTVLAAGPMVGANTITWAFLVTIGWLLVAPRIRFHPQRWLVLWVVLVPVLVLAAPAQGLVLAVAAGALAVVSVHDLLVREGPRGLLVPGAAVSAVVLLAVLTPLGAMLAAAVRYVIHNAEVNTAAYGVPWSPVLAGPSSTPLVLDVLRMGWAVGLVLCSLVALAELRERRWHSERLAKAVFFALFLGGVLPYLMGRVDSGAPSRAGLGTAFVLALVIPVLVWRQLVPTGRAMLAIGQVTAIAAVFGTVVHPETVAGAAAPFVGSGSVVEGSDYGLPGWGRASPADPNNLEQVSRLARILDAELEPGAPYFDATSRNSQYFYIGRRPPVTVAAVYNMPLLADQRRTIRELQETRPGIAVLLQPHGNLNQDGGGPALRTPLLARYLESAYTPYQQEGFILGHLGGETPPDADTTVTLVLDEVTDTNWDRGVSRLSTAFRLDDPGSSLMLPPGAAVVLPDRSRAEVTSSGAGGVIEVDRDVVDSLATQEVRTVEVAVRDLDTDRYHAWLFERAFGQAVLRRLPSAWGASLDTMDGVTELAAVDAAGTLDADTPSLEVSLPEDVVASGRVDLAAFDLRCVGAGTPSMKVSWLDEASSGVPPGRKFSAVPGRQVVPLDSSAFWRAEPARTLRVTLLDGAGCVGVEVSDVSLWERTD